MNAGGRKSYYSVTGLHLAAVDYSLLAYDTHREAAHIVLVLGHKTRVLGSLAADKRTAGFNTAVRDALYDRCDLCRLVLSAGDIVEEEEGLCTAADNIVHAHSHSVDAYGVVSVKQECQLYLRADSVCAGNEHRIIVLFRIELKKPAETADAVNSTLDTSTLNVLLHQPYRLISRGNVNTCCLIAFGMTVFHIVIPFVNVHLFSCRLFKKRRRELLLFSVPAVSAEPALIKSDCADCAGQGLELQRSEL